MSGSVLDEGSLAIASCYNNKILTAGEGRRCGRGFWGFPRSERRSVVRWTFSFLNIFY
jgi:hypothetical protein